MWTSKRALFAAFIVAGFAANTNFLMANFYQPDVVMVLPVHHVVAVAPHIVLGELDAPTLAAPYDAQVFGPVGVVPDEPLLVIAPLEEGLLVRGTGPTVYLVRDESLHGFTSYEVFSRQGHQLKDVAYIGNDIDYYPQGNLIDL
jgi:hypothetical protein